MRYRTTLLLTTTQLALFGLPLSAHAQGIPAASNQIAGDATPSDKASDEQEQVADQATATGADDVVTQNAEDIVVTGLRASLRSSQALKRDSTSIVDAVVAEDIGKLPDNNASEALARISGIQVDRVNDEAAGVLIRGLPDVTTTFNGREIFTADSRGVALQDFPAGALAAIEVYKSGTADLIEPGLAGLVNVRSRRPFDFKGFELAGTVRGNYNDQSRKIDPIGSLLVSNRWTPQSARLAPW